MKTKSDMKPIIIATLSLILLAGCGNDDFPVEEQKVPLEIASAFVQVTCRHVPSRHNYLHQVRSEFFWKANPEPVM